jgi:hypothetical protein
MAQAEIMLSVTNAEGEDFSSLHERVLRFMGAFSSVQFAIDNVIGNYLRRRMSALGPALATAFLDRVRDDQRLDLFKAFAAQAAYDGDLTAFDPIYLRAKQVRDMVGHSLNVSGPVYSPGMPPVVGVASTIRSRSRVPDPLLPSSFTCLTADCEWLRQHIMRAGYIAEPAMIVDLTLQPIEPPIPALLPEGGEPLRGTGH